MPVYELPAELESETASFLVFGASGRIVSVGKDFLSILAADSNTVIRNGNDEFFSGSLQGDDHLPSGPAELDGVRDQVSQNNPENIRIDMHRNARLRFQIQADRFSIGEKAELAAYFAPDLDRITPSVLKMDARHLALGPRKQILHRGSVLLQVSFQAVGQFLELVAAHFLFPNKVEQSLQGVKRSAKVVSDNGKKSVFYSIQFLEVTVFLPKFTVEQFSCPGTSIEQEQAERQQPQQNASPGDHRMLQSYFRLLFSLSCQQQSVLLFTPSRFEPGFILRSGPFINRFLLTTLMRQQLFEPFKCPVVSFAFTVCAVEFFE